jgi:hypothetical protein
VTATVVAVVSLVALVLGVAMVGVRVGPAFADGLFGPTYALPMDEAIHLEKGRWIIFERTGTQRRSGPLTLRENDEVVFERVRARVSDPSGKELEWDFPFPMQTINRNGSIYTGVVSFDAPTSGTYDIALDTSSSTAIISPDIGSALGASAAWLVVAGLGALGCLVGVIVFLTGEKAGDRSDRSVTRRRPVARIGWYPDPEAPSRLRWWNGEQWGASKPARGPSE